MIKDRKHKEIKKALKTYLKLRTSWKESNGVSEKYISRARTSRVDILEVTKRRDKVTLYSIYEIKTRSKDVDEGVGKLLRYRTIFTKVKHIPVGAFLVLPYDCYLEYRKKNAFFEEQLTSLGIGLYVYRSGSFELVIPALEIEEKSLRKLYRVTREYTNSLKPIL